MKKESKIKLIVNGGQSLKGEVLVRGAKNSGFKLMIASLFGESASLLGNLTKAGETKITFSTIEKIGGKIKYVGEHSVRIDPHSLKSSNIPFGIGKESRSSTLFVPVLLYRFGQAKVPWPGGDKIGQRPLDRHFEGMQKMGVKIEKKNDWLHFSLVGRPNACHYRFNKNTHTGTDTLLMMASFAEGETILENAAQEPEVDDLIQFLNKMGAKIKRTASRTISIKGVGKFKGTQHSIIPDRNEAVTFGCAALGTKGEISIFNIRPKDLLFFIKKAKEAGGKIELGVSEMKVTAPEVLLATDIETAPHPGFMTDWQSLWFTLMTQARGKSQVIEKIYPQRFQFAHELIKMGAKVEFFHPQVKNPAEYYDFNPDEDRPDFFHGAWIRGPSPLKGKEVDASDIRAGAALLLAALMAEGKTVIDNAEKLFRGYENLDVRLANLGGQIIRVKENSVKTSC